MSILLRSEFPRVQLEVNFKRVSTIEPTNTYVGRRKTSSNMCALCSKIRTPQGGDHHQIASQCFLNALNADEACAAMDVPRLESLPRSTTRLQHWLARCHLRLNNRERNPGKFCGTSGTEKHGYSRNAYLELWLKQNPKNKVKNQDSAPFIESVNI
jgi:hypothetical protein